MALVAQVVFTKVIYIQAKPTKLAQTTKLPKVPLVHSFTFASKIGNYFIVYLFYGVRSPGQSTQFIDSVLVRLSLSVDDTSLCLQRTDELLISDEPLAHCYTQTHLSGRLPVFPPAAARARKSNTDDFIIFFPSSYSDLSGILPYWAPPPP